MKKEKEYPISEIFVSPQGEGAFSGTAMLFIRLAGCSVGKRYPKEMYEPHDEQFHVGTETVPGLPIYAEMCTLYDGRTFQCDTDYRVKNRLSTKQIFEQLPGGVSHVCVTGGEPFIHDLTEIATECFTRKCMLHVETSGTVALEKAFPNDGAGLTWVTVSPKFPVLPAMIQRANEIKLLVDKDFDPGKLPVSVVQHSLVYIMAVNYEHTVNKENVKLLMQWHKKYPNWRIGLQLHKVLESYIDQRVL